MATKITVAQGLDAVQKLKVYIDGLFAKLIAISPDALKVDEAGLQAVLDTALGDLDVVGIQTSLTEVAIVLKNLKGPIGPGLNADMGGP